MYIVLLLRLRWATIYLDHHIILRAVTDRVVVGKPLITYIGSMYSSSVIPPPQSTITIDRGWYVVCGVRNIYQVCERTSRYDRNINK